MRRNIIVRLWSRVPIFLKILIYGSGGFALMVGYILIRLEASERPCREARAAEAPEWRAMGEHFERWYADHPEGPTPLLPDGGIDMDAVVDTGFSRGSGHGCRRAAEQLERNRTPLFLVVGPAEDDAEGQAMWRQVQATRAHTFSVCFGNAGDSPASRR